MRFRGIVLASLAVGLALPLHAVESRQPLTPSPDQPPAVKGADPPVADSTPHAWGLAADAVLTEENGRSHRLLAGQYPDADAHERSVKILQQWWGVSSQEQLQPVLDRLEQVGQRQEFESLGSATDDFGDTAFDAIRFACKLLSPTVWHRLDVVRQHHRELGSKGLLGWDLMRYIDVNRNAYAAGYLSEDRAWANIMKAAVRLQSTFGSWRELGENYFIGREFWNQQQYRARLPRTQDAYRRLLNDPQSPWLLTPWHLDLQQRSSGTEAAVSQLTSGVSGTRGD